MRFADGKGPADLEIIPKSTNIGNAKVAGLEKDLGLTGYVSLVFIKILFSI